MFLVAGPSLNDMQVCSKLAANNQFEEHDSTVLEFQCRKIQRLLWLWRLKYHSVFSVYIFNTGKGLLVESKRSARARNTHLWGGKMVQTRDEFLTWISFHLKN